MLGLDVHDCAKARAETYKFGQLAAGMVLTVEPGLYFQLDDLTVPERYRGIGVRIEDDVVITAGRLREPLGRPARASPMRSSRGSARWPARRPNPGSSRSPNENFAAAANLGRPALVTNRVKLDYMVQS